MSAESAFWEAAEAALHTLHTLCTRMHVQSLCRCVQKPPKRGFAPAHAHAQYRVWGVCVRFVE